MNMLIQQTQSNSTSLYDVTGVGRFFSTQQANDCAFARAISSYKSDMFTGIDLQGCAPQHILRPVGFIDI